MNETLKSLCGKSVHDRALNEATLRGVINEEFPIDMLGFLGIDCKRVKSRMREELIRIITDEAKEVLEND